MTTCVETRCTLKIAIQVVLNKSCHAIIACGFWQFFSAKVLEIFRMMEGICNEMICLQILSIDRFIPQKQPTKNNLNRCWVFEEVSLFEEVFFPFPPKKNTLPLLVNDPSIHPGSSISWTFCYPGPTTSGGVGGQLVGKFREKILALSFFCWSGWGSPAKTWTTHNSVLNLKKLWEKTCHYIFPGVRYPFKGIKAGGVWFWNSFLGFFLRGQISTFTKKNNIPWLHIRKMHIFFEKNNTSNFFLPVSQTCWEVLMENEDLCMKRQEWPFFLVV